MSSLFKQSKICTFKLVNMYRTVYQCKNKKIWKVQIVNLAYEANPCIDIVRGHPSFMISVRKSRFLTPNHRHEADSLLDVHVSLT